MRNPAIVLMSRVPLPGRTKSRMMEVLSGEECAAFHTACLADICKAVSDTGFASYLYYTGGSAEEFNPRMQNFVMRPQGGRDLGERMYSAASQVLTEHDGVIIMGADVPEIDSKLLVAALKLLDDCDAVIGPAFDGGYYLIGLRKAYRNIFSGIPWGSTLVLEKTLLEVERSGLSCQLIAAMKDIDTWDDMVDFYHRGFREEEKTLKKLSAYRNSEILIKKYGDQLPRKGIHNEG